MSEIIDSYNESNRSSYFFLYGSNPILGQSFTVGGNGYTLSSAKFYLQREGSPTGNAVAKVYNITGTYGSDSFPTGSALAVSDTLDVSTIATGSNNLYELIFSGSNAIDMTPGYYGVSIEYSGGNISNRIWVGFDNTAPTHSGNSFSNFGGADDKDIVFYVHGEPITASSRSNFLPFFI